jgi:protein disulfide-isomerase
MLRTTIYLLLANLCFTLPVITGQERESIPWARDFREATEIAARDRKLVLLHFYADDCPPCRVVEAKVFTNPDVASAMSAAYVPLKVHVEKMPELARRYQIARWPTDVIVNPAGLEVYRTVSSQDPQKYTGMLTEVATRSGTMLARNSAPPPADPVRNALANTNSAYAPPLTRDANAVQGGPYQPRTSAANVANNAPPANPTNDSAPREANTNGVINNPYANAPARSDYNSDFMPAGAAAPPPVASEPVACVPNEAPLPPPPKFEAPAEQPKVAQEAAPAALPPLGMEGYCVVTLTEQVKWSKGDRRFGAIHRGKLYLFAGADEQKKFLADPDHFSPALSGFDPVTFTEAGKLVDGKRAFGLTFNNQMFLFTDEASRNKFEADPRRYAETVFQAMLRSNNANTKLR